MSGLSEQITIIKKEDLSIISNTSEEELIYYSKDYALSDNSRLSYETQWLLFERWCNDSGYISLPARMQTVYEWILYRINNGIAIGTVRVGKSAIAWYHIRSKYDDPTKSVAILDLLKGLRRQQSINDTKFGRKRQAISADSQLLKSMLDAIENSKLPVNIKRRDSAIIGTAYTTAARRSELSNMLISDVEFDGNEYKINITRSKTDQFGEGRVAGVINTHFITAVDYLSEWLDNHPLNWNNAPLFPQLHNTSGVCHKPIALSGRGIARRIAYWGDMIGKQGLTGHSTRRGAASDAARAGARNEDLMRLGGWKSPAMPSRYIASEDTLKNHPLRNA